MRSNQQLFAMLDSYLAPMRPSQRVRVLTTLAEKLARDEDADLVRRKIEESLASVGCEADLRDFVDLIAGR